MSSRFASEFVDTLASVRMPAVFNPYCDVCPDHDLPNAPAIRRSNLQKLLEGASAARVDVLWVGLELGRRGGRRTGLPLTDEPRLTAMSDYWELGSLGRATHGEPMKEETASYVWQAVRQTHQRVLFWNLFPFQCHAPSAATNRNHTLDEARQVADVLPWLVNEIRPRRIVALGRAAHTGLARLGLESRYVRHPGRGGGQVFLATVHGASS